MAVSSAIKDGRLRASVSFDANGAPKINDRFLADKEWEVNSANLKAPREVRQRTAELSVENAAKLNDAAIATPLVMPSAMVTEDEASAELKHWQSQLAELKYREQAGELVNIHKARGRVTGYLTSCKTRLLAIPSRAKQALPHLTIADLEALEGLIREALEALASDKI